MKKIFYKLWTIWFGFLAAFSTLILSPFLFTSLLSPRFFTYFSYVAKAWSSVILFPMGFRYKVYGPKADPKKQYMVVSNHGSYIDIMLTYLVAPIRIMFIGKKELAKFPIFGWFYSRSNILVDRKSADSGKKVVLECLKMIKKGRSISIYPEGTSKKSKRLIKFKDGAFTIAIECGLPVLVLTFLDNRNRLPSLGIGKGPGRLRVVSHEPIETAGMTPDDKEALKEKVRLMMEEDLDRYGVR